MVKGIKKQMISQITLEKMEETLIEGVRVYVWGIRPEATASHRSRTSGAAVSSLSHLTDPRMQVRQDRSKQKEMAHRSHPITTEYGSSRCSVIMLASRLRQTVSSGAMPPPVVKTRGEKHPCSTSRTRRA